VTDLPLPADLNHWAFGLMLVLARVGGAMMLLPGLGETAPPGMVRAGMAGCIALMLLPGLLPTLPQPPEASAQAALMTCAEVATGVWFGWLARTLVLALPAAGQFLAYAIGISNVLQSDAELGPQTTAMARLFDMALPALILSTGLYRVPIAALEGLYRVIPAGTLLPAGDGAQMVLRAVGDSFALALRLASPFILGSVVWHAGTGLLARFLPRLQIYFVAVPGQILGGLLLLAALSGALISAWMEATRSGLSALPGGG
jgi:flagellar biosynthesis protein FliR